MWTKSGIVAYGIACAFIFGAFIVLGMILGGLVATWDLPELGFFASMLGGFLGGAAVIGAIFLALWLRQKSLVRALYSELYNRASRCCLDLDTWIRIVKNEEKVTLSRFRKFRPAEPTVFISIGEGIGLIPKEPIGPLIAFYGFLDGVRRDVDKDPEIITELSIFGSLESCLTCDEKNLFAKRLCDTISPALKAVSAFRKYELAMKMNSELNEANRPYLLGEDLYRYLERHHKNIEEATGKLIYAKSSVEVDLPL